MGHVVTIIGGAHIDLKTADQAGAVYTVVPQARQRAALRFLSAEAIRTPAWLTPDAILSRIGPQSGGSALATRQAGIVASLLEVRRLDRLAMAETMDTANAYPLATYLGELRRAVWGSSAGDASVTLDANRRVMQRVYIERLEALVNPPEREGGGGFFGGSAPPLVTPPNIPRSDLPALARSELVTIRAQSRQAATATAGVARAHWQDIVARIDKVIEPR